MIGLKAYLLKLPQNLNLFRQREVKFGGQAPLELLNQLDDHHQAIALTEQALKGEISEAAWRETLAPLLVSLPALEADETALAETYLTRLLDQAGYLSLAGLDPKAATAQSEARLNLDAVYTALLTLSQEQDKTFEAIETSKVSAPGRESRRLSVLIQLNHVACRRRASRLLPNICGILSPPNWPPPPWAITLYPWAATCTGRVACCS